MVGKRSGVDGALGRQNNGWADLLALNTCSRGGSGSPFRLLYPRKLKDVSVLSVFYVCVSHPPPPPPQKRTQLLRDLCQTDLPFLVLCSLWPLRNQRLPLRPVQIWCGGAATVCRLDPLKWNCFLKVTTLKNPELLWISNHKAVSWFNYLQSKKSCVFPWFLQFQTWLLLSSSFVWNCFRKSSSASVVIFPPPPTWYFVLSHLTAPARRSCCLQTHHFSICFSFSYFEKSVPLYLFYGNNRILGFFSSFLFHPLPNVLFFSVWGFLLKIKHTFWCKFQIQTRANI